MLFKNKFVYFIIIFLISNCNTIEVGSEFEHERVDDIEDVEIRIVAQNQLELSFTSKIFETYSSVLINVLINDVFANFNRYSLKKIDSNTATTVDIAKVTFIDKTKYKITTIGPLQIGEYQLVIQDTQRDEPNIDELFNISSISNIQLDDDQLGNYYQYQPITKKFPDGIILSVIDAEIGVPSFYNLKLSIPSNFFESSSEIRLNYKKLNNNNIKEKGSNIQLSIRKSLLTGFDPTEQITSETMPINNYYDEIIDDQEYQSIEMLLFLDDIPKESTFYQASIDLQTIGQGEYISEQFDFRQSFTTTKLITYSNMNSNVICFKSENSGKVKCIGENYRWNTGYPSAGIFIESHPYQLEFLDQIENVDYIAMTDDASCAIIDGVLVNNVKCWGNNHKGQLGVDSDVTNQNKGDYNYGDEGFLVAKPDTAEFVANPSDGLNVNYNKIFSGQFNFCSIAVNNNYYCWGGFKNSTIITLPHSTTEIEILKPTKIDIEYTQNNTTYDLLNIDNLAMGISPSYCFTADAESNNSTLDYSIYCNYTELNRISLPLNANQKIDKISIGVGHFCFLFKENNQLVENNIGCMGENYAYQLGTGNSINYDSIQILDLGDKTARDLIAGSGYTCILTTDDKMKCVGTANGLESLTDYQSNDKIFTTADYFDFGDNITVDSFSKGEFVICTTLKLSLNNSEKYAPKCWGRFKLSGMLYYLKTADLSNGHILLDYNHVIRW